MPSPAPRELLAVDKQVGIRFLTVVSTLTRGGTERAAMNFALGYHHAGFPSAVLAFGGGGPRLATLESAGIPVFVGGPSPQQRDQALADARAWNPDIVHVNRPGQQDDESARVLRYLVHPRMRVWETNVFGYADRSEDRVLIDLHLVLARWCLWKWSAAVRGLNPQSPATIVPYLVDCGQFRSISADKKQLIRSQWKIPANAVVFGRIGQALDGKWSPTLVACFQNVARRLPNAWLAVCGPPPSIQSAIRSLPADIRSRVVELPMTDSDEELLHYYALMDIFVHASAKGESFGYVLCEAMLSGLPVITLSTPLRDNSQIEVVPHGQTGIVVSNQREMVEAMLRLAREPAAAQELSSQGPGWVKEHYDIPVVTRRLVQLAPQILASTSGEELAGRIRAIGLDVAPVGPGFYKDLLQTSGIKPTVRERFFAPAVNHHLSRRAIAAVRALRASLRHS